MSKSVGTGSELGGSVRLLGDELGRAYALAGMKPDALKVLKQLQQISGRMYVPPYFFATIYGDLGQRDEAFRWLNKAFEERDTYAPWLKVDSAIDSLRSDSRFQPLLVRLRLADSAKHPRAGLDASTERPLLATPQ